MIDRRNVFDCTTKLGILVENQPSIQCVPPFLLPHPHKPLNHNQSESSAQVLVEFFSDKVDDHECVPASLKALNVLAKLPTFGDGDTQKTFKA